MSGVKALSLTEEVRQKLQSLSAGEGGGIPGVEVKFVDIGRNTRGEGGDLDGILTLNAKAWGANRIRYPGSPRCKRWVLGVVGVDPRRAGANAISSPPGKYGRKTKTQRN